MGDRDDAAVSGSPPITRETVKRSDGEHLRGDPIPKRRRIVLIDAEGSPRGDVLPNQSATHKQEGAGVHGRAHFP